MRSLRSRGLEVVGGRENRRARGRHACILLSRAFFLVATISKRLLRWLVMRWGGTYRYSLYKGVPPPPPGAADHHDHLGPFRSFKFHLKSSLPWCMLHSEQVNVDFFRFNVCSKSGCALRASEQRLSCASNITF